jgi:hypothetical protein
MLTEQEKKWLEFRKYRKAPCGDETHHCVGCDDCPGIPFCNLYLARIAVEEKMD